MESLSCFQPMYVTTRSFKKDSATIERFTTLGFKADNDNAIWMSRIADK